MSHEEIKGVVGEVAGKIQKTVGELSGDDKMQLEGAAREVAGKAKAKYGEAVDDVRDLASRKPIAAIAMGVGVGFLLGALFARRP
jgi:uncharacterized protein YjbJ (UPF0337 family)